MAALVSSPRIVLSCAVTLAALLAPTGIAEAKPLGELSRSEALGVAREEHRWAFAPSEVKLDHGDRRVSRYISQRSAIVKDEAGRSSVAVASEPVAAPGPDGTLSPIDLGLRKSGNRFVPNNAAVDLLLGKAASDDVAFGSDGLLIEPLVGASAAPAAMSDGQLFYADAGGTDSGLDMILKPLPGGLETFYQLRTAGQKRIALRLSGPGVSLDKRPDGSVAVRRAGRVIARIAPPVARDADGNDVEVSAKTTGSTLILDVDTTGHTLPVMVDPTISEEYLFWDQGTGVDFGGWEYRWNTDYLLFRAGNTDDPIGGPAWGRGLYVYTSKAYNTTPSATLGSQDWGEWRFDPPGSAYVESLYFGGISNFYNINGQPQNGQAEACSQIGMYSTTLGRFEDKQVWTSDNSASGIKRTTSFCRYRDHQAESHTGTPGTSTAATPNNYAVFKAYAPQGGRTGPFNIYFSGGVLYLGDDNAPEFTSISHSNPDYGKWSGGQSDTVTLNAKDDGLGMKYIDLWDAGTGNPVPTYSTDGQGASTCLGKRYAACPPTMTTAITYNTTGLSEGIHTIHAKAEDILGKKTDTSWMIKIDRTKPSATLGGDLAEAGVDYVAGNATVNLAVAASEPGASRAGVATVGISNMSGEDLVSTNIECPSISGARQCPQTPNDGNAVPLSFTTAGLSEGTHDLQGYARDDAGNVGNTSQIAMIVDRTGPAFDPAASFSAARDAATGDAVALGHGTRSAARGRESGVSYVAIHSSLATRYGRLVGQPGGRPAARFDPGRRHERDDPAPGYADRQRRQRGHDKGRFGCRGSWRRRVRRHG